MRNIFDQYTQPENRLTHALACCLQEDRKLLGRFIKWATNDKHPHLKQLRIVEQRLPGTLEILSEDEAERLGLPDAWIHDNLNWSLIIESKVSATLSINQLQRHYKTALSRGFEDISLLALDITKPKRKLPQYVYFKKWTEVYSWFSKQSRESQWAKRMILYMEAAENRMISDGYLKEGTLTTFSGIPFDDSNPYNYTEAKRVLRLAMEELRKSSKLQKILGMDPKGQGRPAITGKDSQHVWDFVPLKQARGNSSFTKYPHLTLVIRQDNVFALVSIPNGIKTEYRRNLLGDNKDAFIKLFSDINNNIDKVINKAKGSYPWIEFLQRHYPSQRSRPIVDARLEFDLRTMTTISKNKGKTRNIKMQPIWLDSVYEVLSKKKANVHLGIGVVFPYNQCNDVGTKKVLDHIENVWIALKPLLDAMLS